MIGVDCDKAASEEPRPLEFIVRATFLPPGCAAFVTGSGPFQSRATAEEAACRMLFDPRVICVEIIEQ